MTRSEHGFLPKNRCSLRLVDIPEDRRGRTVEHTGERFPPGGGAPILPERDIKHVVKNFVLDLGRDLLLLLRRRRTREGIAERFNRWIIGPTEPAAMLPFAVDQGVADGVRKVDADEVGEEYVPAALLRRLLTRAASDHGLPVGRLHIHLEASGAE